MTPLLISVQAMELAWVGLNYAGIEQTTTESTVHTVADIHLSFMPYSHSVTTAIGGALLVWLIVERVLRRPWLGRAMAIGVVSHLVLDLATHARDIAWWPGSGWPALGLGLYEHSPMWGFAVEMAYGVLCWWIFRGRGWLLAAIVLGNFGNLTMFSVALAGPEEYMAGHPSLIVTVILVQIVVTMGLVGALAGGPATRRSSAVAAAWKGWAS